MCYFMVIIFHLPARGAGLEIDDAPATVEISLSVFPFSLILKTMGCGIFPTLLCVAVLRKCEEPEFSFFIYCCLAS